MWKAGIQLDTSHIEGGHSHSKCVECDDTNVHDNQTRRKTRTGQEDNNQIEENKKNKKRPDDKIFKGLL